MRQLPRLLPEGQALRERIEILKNLGDWSWKPRDDGWEKFVREFRKYLAENGTACVERDYKTPDGYPLGTRVDRQRWFYKKGKVSADRIEMLESIGDWSWEPRASREQEGWEEFLGELRKCLADKGTVRVLDTY